MAGTNLLWESEQIVSACHQYYTAAKDARQEILRVITVVSDLKGALDNVRVLLDGHKSAGSTPLPMLTSLEESLASCESDIQLIATKLGIKSSSKTGRCSNDCKLSQKANSMAVEIEGDQQTPWSY